MRRSRLVVLVTSLGIVLDLTAQAVFAVAPPGHVFVPLPPCRLADTRVAGGTVTGGTNRVFKVLGSVDLTTQGGPATGCGVPGFNGSVAQVQAIALGVVAIGAAANGYLTAFAGDTPRPPGSTLNYTPAAAVSNEVIVQVRQAAPAGTDIKIFVSATTDVVLDVTGYFADITLVDGSGSGLDADKLDGLDSSAFGDITGVTAGTGLAGGATSGNATLNLNLAASNTWTGNTMFDPASGLAFSTGAGDDIELGGSVRKFGLLFLHNANFSSNLGVGLSALAANTSGSYNTATGGSALAANTTGLANTATGAGAMKFNTAGRNNTATGVYALKSNTIGSRNTASGDSVMAYNTSGSDNVATGAATLQSNTTGGFNTAVGRGALSLNSTGSANTALGSYAGDNLTTGSNNIDIGNRGVAGESTTIRLGTGGTQTRAFIAGISGSSTGSGTAPVCIDSAGQLGTDSCPAAASGDITGVAAGTGLTGGGTSGDVTLNLNLTASNTWTGNTTFNPASGLAFSTGSGDDIDLGGNVKKGGTLFISSSAGLHDTSLGAGALGSSSGGGNDTAIGFSALSSNTSGNLNTAVGDSALMSNTSSSNNTAVGTYALRNNTGGYTNTATGALAMRYNTSGHDNTADGWRALFKNTTGNRNTAQGVTTMDQNTTGSANAAFGFQALHDNTTSGQNSALGYRALFQSTGSGNTALGFKSGYNLVTGNDNVDIAHQAVNGESATIRIGTPSTHTATFIAGINGATIGASPSAVCVDSNGQLGTSPSCGAAGTVTSVGSGTGLTGGPITSAGSLSLDLTASNTWTGNTTFNPASGLAFSTGSGDDIDLGGNVKKDGTLFLHNAGSDNLGVGLGALAENTSGAENAATGINALGANTTGSGNTASGASAMKLNTAGYSNAAVGTNALHSNTLGAFNTAVGASALASNTTGNNNIAVGRRAGYDLTTGSFNIDIGNPGLAGEISTIRIGNSLQSQTFIAGISGAATGSGTTPVCIDSAGQLGTASCGTSGTVTSVGSGTGLTGGPITGSGTLSLDLAAGLTWTGTTTFNASSGYAIVTGTGKDINLGGNVKKSSVLFLHNTGTNNLGVGLGALSSVTTGAANTATGASALAANTGGAQNTATGYKALGANLTGFGNTATGHSALRDNTTGSRNTAIGLTALRVNTSGQGNTALGYTALLSNTIGIQNTATGYAALGLNVDGRYNTATGGNALVRNASGFHNTATGDSSSFYNVSGSNNTAVGASALRLNLGSSNIGLGANGGSALTTGDNNIDIGNQGVAAESGAIRIGGTLQAKTFIAGIRDVTTDNADQIPVCIDSAGQLGTGACAAAGTVTSVGSGTGLTGGPITTTGSLSLDLTASNTWTGNTTFNPASGLAFSTGTGDDIDLGGSVKKSGSLFLHTTGAGNTALGYNALLAPTTGVWNTALGDHALRANTAGSKNTATGNYALFFNTTGEHNTANGYVALYGSTGDRNTATGSLALHSNSTGSGNIALGYKAGLYLTTGDNNIDIGNQGVNPESNTIRIGTVGTQTSAFMAGINGATVDTGSGTTVFVDVNGQLGTIVSSRRYKEEIHDMADLSERILKLRPVTFRYKKEVQKGERPVEFGLIAEEVAEVFPELVVYGTDGKPQTVKYHVLAPLLLNELQKQKLQVEAGLAAQRQEFTAQLAAQREEFAGRLSALLDRLAALETRGGRSLRGRSRLRRVRAPPGAESDPPRVGARFSAPGAGGHPVHAVAPAKAGAHSPGDREWIPACAGTHHGRQQHRHRQPGRGGRAVPSFNPSRRRDAAGPSKRGRRSLCASALSRRARVSPMRPTSNVEWRS